MIGRLEVSPGNGTVIRYGGIVAWASQSASPALVSFLAQSARNLGPSPKGGYEMAEHIAAVLVDSDPEPNVGFAVIGPTSRGWAALLHGPVQAWDGDSWLVPNPSAGWIKLMVSPHPSITVNAAGASLPELSPDSAWDLEAGVVPGSGFLLVPADAAGATGASTITLPVADPTEVFAVLSAADLGRAEPGVDLDADVDLRTGPELTFGPAPGPNGSLDLRRVTKAAGPPLPVGRGAEDPIPGAPVVGGVLCERGHLNRPGRRDCARCSTPIPGDQTKRVSGTRPALGCLIVDNGSVFRLDQGYLAGSNPDRDPTVQGGLARPLVLAGEDVAAVHAEIRLHDWDVVVTDRASAGGTCVYDPGDTDWTPLNPYEPRILLPGSHVAFGSRIVTFVTPWVSPAGAAPDTAPDAAPEMATQDGAQETAERY
jgi:hypothetical protein